VRYLVRLDALAHLPLPDGTPDPRPPVPLPVPAWVQIETPAELSPGQVADLVVRGEVIRALPG